MVLDVKNIEEGDLRGVVTLLVSGIGKELNKLVSSEYVVDRMSQHLLALLLITLPYVFY